MGPKYRIGKETFESTEKRCDESASIFRLISECEINRHWALRTQKMETLRHNVSGYVFQADENSIFFLGEIG